MPFGDVELFLLDDRYHRDHDGAANPAQTLFGAAQLKWLKGALRDSLATFKVVANGSRMLGDRPLPELRGGEDWHNFPLERQAFLDPPSPGPSATYRAGLTLRAPRALTLSHMLFAF